MRANAPNQDTSRGWAYHNATKHSESSVRSNPHYLDWSNQPMSFKIYTTLEPIPLPRDADQTGISAFSAIRAMGISSNEEKVPTLRDLARILYFCAGITRKKTFPGGEIYFRAASCTGALYEFELYVVCGGLPDLAAGVYHFGPGDFALRTLRTGDYRGVLAQATANETHIVHAPVTIVCAGTYWRNAWKYRSRTYRHFGWDNGTILANMLGMAAALFLPSHLVLGFVDSDVNALLGLDTNREAAFSMVGIGRTSGQPPQPPQMSRLEFPTAPLSAHEIDYPELREIHAASSLESVEAVTEWRSVAVQAARGQTAPAPADIPSPSDTIEQVILRRGSSRSFAREAIGLAQVTAILNASTRGVWPGFPLLNDLYLIINAVDGLSPGAYHYLPDSGELECLRPGNFRNEAYHLGLQQSLPGDAALDVFFLADLHSIFDRLGNRGYRAVQLEAGIIGGKMYLAAYASRLGATGLTFFDDDVTAFFSPHAAGKSAIFLMAIGKGRRF